VLAQSSARIPAFALSQRAYFGLPATMTGVTAPGAWRAAWLMLPIKARGW